MTGTAFFQQFDRHANGKGLKGASTHYCPGCGHGLAHKYLAEAMEELGVTDRTVAISPVGCSVFLYYYFDAGNTQAAHGRAPAVALAHKLANPRSIVVSYQGDGDLASIGLAEIIHAAQVSIPITVIFVNNAIYGMTGGQMAPTTLMGQVSATSPSGRERAHGLPLRVAEMIAGMEGPSYVERVALYDIKTRKRARRAIAKALRLQVEGRGFAFVEVLAECPTHLKMTGPEAEAWVRDEMTQAFPLGVFKDLEPEPWFDPAPPTFDAARLLAAVGAATDSPPRFGSPFPSHIAPRDVSLKLAGAGGDGAQTAALLIARSAMNEGFDATHIPSYGPESRGGTSYADVHVAQAEVLSPASPHPHVLVAFNAPSLHKFAPDVAEGGVVVYDSTVVTEAPRLPPGVRAVPVPCTAIAHGLGKLYVKNVVALGALQRATSLLRAEAFRETLRDAMKSRPELVALNEQALAAGGNAVTA